MTFSIVIPTYNGDKYIEKAIQSALSQTRLPDEIIVHDDNSTDNTYVICKKYESKIKYFVNTEGPSGFVNGWNKSISLATNEYITILHQDDILYPTFLEEAEKVLKEHQDIKHLFAICDYIDEDDNLIHNADKISTYFNLSIIRFTANEYVRAYQNTYDNIGHIHRCPGVITHRKIFDYCQYNVQAGHIADDDFFFRVGQYTDVIGIIKPLAAYRHHNDSETSSIGDVNLVDRLSDDYIFQLKQWNDSHFMGNDEKKYFIENAFKYNNRLLGYGLRFFRFELIKKSICNLLYLKKNGFINNNGKVRVLFQLLSLIIICKRYE